MGVTSVGTAGGTLFDVVFSNTGAPQGTVLSPFLSPFLVHLRFLVK